MAKSVNYQINRIFVDSEIFAPGEKKHSDKNDALKVLEKAGLSGTSQRISEKTKIHSYETARDYKDTWHKLGHYARSQGLKDMTHIEQKHVVGYLEQRIIDGVSHSTWKKEASHLGKLGAALERFSEKVGYTRDYAFREPINNLRQLAQNSLETPERDRGYTEPQNVIQEIRSPVSKLLAKIQHEGGARCHEVGKIRVDQLLGNNTIKLTNTKGGMPRDITVQPDTYQQLQKMLGERGGVVQVKSSTYRNQIARAAKLAGETNSGTHDFRYNFARDRYLDLTKKGYIPEQAHYLISEEMGHHRPDITLHYLR